MRSFLKNGVSLFSIFLPVILFLSGCGYTTQNVLPRDIKTIYVATTINKIPISEVYAHQPGLEMDITNAIIRRFHLDGNLKVVTKDKADALLESHLTAFEQEGLRFSSLEQVEEYRMFIVLDLRLKDNRNGEVIWREPNFSGDAEYFVSDVRSTAREQASKRAVDDLAKNVVDRVVEDW